ncbi:hypothetical protein ACHAWF_005719 [Thalassiosira exigua]
MKTFSSTILILAVALTSSASANKCERNLPQQTSAHPYGRNYVFSREGVRFGGPTPSNKCNGRKISAKNNVSSTEKCASTCADDDANSDSRRLVLLGYNYDCRTQKCECIRGHRSDDLDRTVTEVPGNWACYKSNAASVVTAEAELSSTSSKNQCERNLPQQTTAHPYGRNYVFSREGVRFGGPTPSSKCSGKKMSTIRPEERNVSSAEKCASACADDDANSASHRLVLLGYNYDCHKHMCQCIRGHRSEDLDRTVEEVPGNWACYKSNAASVLTAELSSTSSKNQCERDLPQQTSAHPYGRNYVFSREGVRYGGPTPSNKCSGKKMTEKSNVSSAEKCASTCADVDANSDLRRIVLLGYNYDCRTRKCECIRGHRSDNLDRTVKEVSGNWACYKADGLKETMSYLRARA